MFIEVNDEQLDHIVYEQLLKTREYFLEDLERARPSVFSNNEVYDKLKIIEHIQALDLILDWYK